MFHGSAVYDDPSDDPPPDDPPPDDPPEGRRTGGGDPTCFDPPERGKRSPRVTRKSHPTSRRPAIAEPVGRDFLIEALPAETHTAPATEPDLPVEIVVRGPVDALARLDSVAPSIYHRSVYQRKDAHGFLARGRHRAPRGGVSLLTVRSEADCPRRGKRESPQLTEPLRRFYRTKSTRPSEDSEMKLHEWMKVILTGRRTEIEGQDEWEEVREKGYWAWILEKGMVHEALAFSLFFLGFYFLLDQIGSQLAPWWFIIVTLAVSAVGLGHYWARRAWRQARERFE